MTMLTPGTLLKLLQSMNTDTKVGGEHRFVILQVIGIVPALSGPDLWPNHGFYIQLSDSVNSTYVSHPDSDADTIQLGQFVHLDRLHFDPPSPVPRASGLRPVSGSRPHPCLGSPEPLVTRVSSNHSGFVIQTAPSDQPPPPPIIDGKRCGEEKRERKVFVSASVAVKNQNSSTAVKRRFSSPASSKIMGRKSNGSGGGSADCESSTSVRTVSRPSSPAVIRCNTRPSSPIPSKCEVPGLVVAKEENRRIAREAAIVVPSRYRQPSPVSVRKAIASSPTSRRISSSPGRRLSGGFRVSPLVGEGGSKKKMVAMVGGISKISEVLMGSSKSVRKSWENEPLDSNSSSERHQKQRVRSKINKPNNQGILRTQVAITRRLSDANGKQNNVDEEASIPEKPTANQKTNLMVSDKFTRATPKITVHDRKWTDGNFPLDVLPENLSRLGKEALQRKNDASVAAAEALEEACATESIIRNLSFFSDLFSTAKVWNPMPTIDRFVSMYDDVLKHIVVAESLAVRRSGGGTNDAESMDRYKSISLWIDAALATDLEVISLLNNGTGSLPKQKSPLKPSGKVSTNLPKRISIGTPSKNYSKHSSRQGASGVWVRGSGLEETLELGLALKFEMERWFLKFVEEALDAGFQLLGDTCAGAGGEMSSSTLNQEKNGRVAAVLSHLKRVNEWLDIVGKKMDDSSKQTIERLKKKIYGFVIRHVGSAFDSAVSLASS